MLVGKDAQDIDQDKNCQFGCNKHFLKIGTNYMYSICLNYTTCIYDIHFIQLAVLRAEAGI